MRVCGSFDISERFQQARFIAGACISILRVSLGYGLGIEGMPLPWWTVLSRSRTGKVLKKGLVILKTCGLTRPYIQKSRALSDCPSCRLLA